MIGIAGVVILAGLIAITIEALRWGLRLEARRLRVIKKIGRRQ